MVEDVADAILSSRYFVALTGAGVSAESGIPTFRGKDGLWNKYRPEELANPEAFAKDPEKVWRWYAWRMEKVFSAEPNKAHFAFAELEKMGLLKTLITQNVDDLHERAGSKNVLHLHGSLRVVKCTTCKNSFEIENPPAVPPLPKCEKCGSLLRPGVVWFGEMLPPDILERAFREVEVADLIIVAGTSAVVQPAASLPLIVKRHGGIVIEINPAETPLSSIADYSLRGKAGEVMEEILQWIRKVLS
ncbi:MULTISPECIES: NAD-dependent protein deacetylase [unclassified Archaeoglobus]|jgi:NAD-dependent deacetylase|uniref:NAD-dependent protein deacetylase n=1 Tax=unclassified Archaeoglobus TaxID=2643606 RepID=UPI0025C4F92A|nr:MULTISPECIES: NAD-dependent protein deacetylase [unclassified Archaeoglobus]